MIIGLCFIWGLICCMSGSGFLHVLHVFLYLTGDPFRLNPASSPRSAGQLQPTTLNWIKPSGWMDAVWFESFPLCILSHSLKAWINMNLPNTTYLLLCWTLGFCFPGAELSSYCVYSSVLHFKLLGGKKWFLWLSADCSNVSIRKCEMTKMQMKWKNENKGSN